MSSPSWLAVVKDKLARVGVRVRVRDVGSRTCDEVLDAEDWADAEIAASKDPAVQRKPRPVWLPEVTA